MPVPRVNTCQTVRTRAAQRNSLALNAKEQELLSYFNLFNKSGEIVNSAPADLRFYAQTISRALARHQQLPPTLSTFTSEDIGLFLILARKIEDS